MAGKKSSTNSGKSKDKKVKKKVEEEKQLVLTPSEKALGIRITQPKRKTIDALNRLYAVPSEKLRVWTTWLTKIGERADDWQWWLRSYIGFALEISEHLQRANAALEAENSVKFVKDDGKSDAGTTMPEKLNEAAETATEIKETDLNEAAETSPEQEAAPLENESSPEKLDNAAVPEVEPEARKEETVADVPEEESSKARGDKNGVTKKGKKKTKGGKQEEKIVYEEGFWPFGVRWKPMSLRNKQNPPRKRQPDKITLPKTEKEMKDLILGIRHQGVVYRSLYKHWSETGDQAVREMIGRKVLPTKDVFFNGEELPYFFYLGTEPDIDYVIEHDDEEVLLPDPGRERITHDFTHLYFNLSDKPGKGGKPWI